MVVSQHSSCSRVLSISIFQRFVVVCPSSLVKNWAREFDKWIGIAGQPKRIIVKGGAEGVAQMKAFNVLKPNSQSEVLIISYDLFRMNVELLEHIKKVALLVVDEGNDICCYESFFRSSLLFSMQTDICIMCIVHCLSHRSPPEEYKRFLDNDGAGIDAVPSQTLHYGNSNPKQSCGYVFDYQFCLSWSFG